MGNKKTHNILLALLLFVSCNTVFAAVSQGEKIVYNVSPAGTAKSGVEADLVDLSAVPFLQIGIVVVV